MISCIRSRFSTSPMIVDRCVAVPSEPMLNTVCLTVLRLLLCLTITSFVCFVALVFVELALELFVREIDQAELL